MSWIRPFRDVGLDDIPLVGGKNASLGEMLRELEPLGVRIPDGFAVTADAYRDLIRGSGLEVPIRAALAGLRKDGVDDLVLRAGRVRTGGFRRGTPTVGAAARASAIRSARARRCAS